MLKTCLICGKEWKAKGTTGKYCSRECFYKSKTTIGQTEKICPTCGKSFIVDSGHIDRKYCSFPCSVKGRDRDNWHKYDERICHNCQKPFKIISWRKDKFCCHKCSTDANRGKPNHRQKAKQKITQAQYRKYTTSGGRKILIHRHVMEKIIGRRLEKSEIVHHIDLDKENIDEKNLALFESEQAHQVAHRSIDALIKPLMKFGVIEFKGNKYILAVTGYDKETNNHDEAVTA